MYVLEGGEGFKGRFKDNAELFDLYSSVKEDIPVDSPVPCGKGNLLILGLMQIMQDIV